LAVHCSFACGVSDLPIPLRKKPQARPVLLVYVIGCGRPPIALALQAVRQMRMGPSRAVDFKKSPPTRGFQKISKSPAVVV
jgi:hypothetical protein